MLERGELTPPRLNEEAVPDGTSTTEARLRRPNPLESASCRASYRRLHNFNRKAAPGRPSGNEEDQGDVRLDRLRYSALTGLQSHQLFGGAPTDSFPHA
jgi:hypothetical protein